MEFITSNLPYVLIAIAILVVLGVISSGYVKAPPDTAYIISGFRKKIIVGKASIKVPFLERLDRLSLKLIPIDVKTSSMVPTADYINIQVDAAVNVKVGSDGNKLELAAQNFLNQDSDYMAKVAREVLEGNMREIVGRMRLEEMVSDRQKFAELVKENAMPDLAAMGLDIVSFNVQNFTDANGVIDDLGIDNISQIKKKAAIAKAEADKEIAIAKAEADRQANDARVASEQSIAIKNNELNLQRAELKTKEDTAKAEADAAYKIQAQEQRKHLDIVSTNADIAKREREIELRKQEVEVEKQSLDATIKQKAEADKFAAEQKADADKYITEKKAEADLIKRSKDAEAKQIELEREAAGILAKGQAEAKTKQLAAEAEAEGIKKKLLAEAEGMEKKAEAYQKYNDAAMSIALINILPEVAKQIAAPLAQIDKVTVFSGDGEKAGGTSSIMNSVPIGMARTFETLKETTGIDLTEIAKSQTYDAKVNRNINVSANVDA
ncbi:flotillin family protein [[Clostridium] innocuum]|uniref:flotillin family protein n=1 Tax=Clostridium innocuum TaxID=1522 RepID=UPI000D6D8820|nr:flotillin family protein [[Clostridium] innocuum]MCR0317405.1 flotillin family protein [[Clostridium] innocuum]MCR0371678.1 flotillin family protein [[Clostridium] innocuum]MCR0375959.1 flotillin family protein [[Clostridium] innocuum]MCR0561809.1 flotillin family protein [[Clostridium] innocuum]MCR0604239.1 flotillin family protein [[Clostridium] innocuum]